MMKPEVYISVDIETDGPIPGLYSMLSFGAAAFTPESETPLGTFTANLEVLQGASQSPDTMAWWKTQPKAWEACHQDLQDPKVAIENFVAWVQTFDAIPVFVGYPAGFDFTFMYYYMRLFGGESPFSFSALDIKSYASSMLKIPYRQATKKNMPRAWFPKTKHTHVALEDAIEQGILFLRMLNQNLSRPL